MHCKIMIYKGWLVFVIVPVIRNVLRWLDLERLFAGRSCKIATLWTDNRRNLMVRQETMRIT